MIVSLLSFLWEVILEGKKEPKWKVLQCQKTVYILNARVVVVLFLDLFVLKCGSFYCLTSQCSRN